MLSALFSLLTTFTIHEGWTAGKLTAGFFESFVAIAIATISGMIILVIAAMLLTFRKIKRIYFEKDRIKLMPANSQMSPIFATHVKIQGKVVGVIRRFTA